MFHPVYIGIDPGDSGGIAAIIQDEVYTTILNPKRVTETAVADWLLRYGAFCAEVQLELVHSSPQMGVRSAFTFGGSYKFLRGVMIAHRIPFCEVRPKVWQKALGITYPKGATDTQKKNITKGKAQQLFPGVKVTHAIADALLIARYAQLKGQTDD